MFDKLITVNYRRGLGGEFFCHLLDQSYSGREFDQDTRFGTYNRFEYVGVDFIFKTYLHHFLWCAFSDYSGIEEYVDKEFGYPNKYNLSLRKNLTVKRMEGLIRTYNTMIKDADKSDQVLNIRDYAHSVCKEHYDEYFAGSDDLFTVSNLHYNSTNKFAVPVNFFFPNSKNLCLVNNNVDEYFYTLLWIYKRLPDLKYYPAAYKSAYKNSKQELKDYFHFERKKVYGSFEGELAVEVFDFHYRGLNIDEKLSELLGIRVKLDYDRVRAYAAKNREIIMNEFDVDVFKDYTQEQIYDKFHAYVDRVYDEI